MRVIPAVVDAGSTQGAYPRKRALLMAAPDDARDPGCVPILMSISSGKSAQTEYKELFKLAETEGFEPSVPDLPVRRFSKPLVSATHPRLRMVRRANDGFGLGGSL